MVQAEKLFENFLDDIRITSSRLLNFANDNLNKLTVANGGGDYTALINTLTPLIAAFGEEVGSVDTSLTMQKGATLTLDQVLQNFKQTMSDEEPFIARALGGSNMPAYLQFYPQGKGEYGRATKTNMPVLTNRVNTAASNNAAALGPALTALLQTFESDWQNNRNDQQQQKGAVNENRTDRSDAREALELALLTTVHTIGAMYPGNVQQCLSFFDFNMLFAQTKRKHTVYTGDVAPGATIQVLNRTFTDTATITLRNTDDNATFMVWLSATADAAPPGTATDVNPGDSHTLKPSQLGSLENTFLLIHNSSAVNEGAYEVEVVG